MPLVVVRRSFDTPQDFAELQAVEDAHRWCLDQRRVVFKRTLLSRDQRTMLCFYEAPDAESVREAQREAGLPFTEIWAVGREA